MTIFGKHQALFKVSVAAKPAKEDNYILAEVEQQDDVTVTRIDVKSGVVTFNNRGEVQPLTASLTLAAVAVTQNPEDNMPYGKNNIRRFGQFGRNRGTSNIRNNSNNTGIN